MLLSCALASNFPDLDLFLTKLLPDPLGYLLNHRGHTHTLLYALPQALLLAALLWLCWPGARALLRQSSVARLGLAISTVTGLALHMLMDYTNSFGIHPLYPFDGRWFFGDMVFIVEPLFWVAFGVPLALMLRRLGARAAVLGVLAAALGFFAFKGYLGWASCLGLGVLALVTGMAQHRSGATGRAGLLLALAVSVGFIGLQGVASHAGRQAVTAAVLQRDAGAQVVDVAMTAFPSQPLCWAFVSMEVNEGAGRYRLRRGVASVAPEWLAPLACPRALVEPGAVTALSPALAQFSQQDASLAALRALKKDNCFADAWLRFGRVPALDLGGGSLSDYRFAVTPAGNFTTLPLEMAKHAACPKGVPRWEYPRAGVLMAP